MKEMKGKKSRWLPLVIALLEEKKEITRKALMETLKGIPPSAITRYLKMGIIAEEKNAKHEKVLILQTSETQARLKEQIRLILKPLSLYPLETVSASFSTLSGADYLGSLSAIEGTNFILEKQFKREMERILKRYEKMEYVQLLKSLAKVIVIGIDYCLKNKVGVLKSTVEPQIRVYPEKLFQITQMNLDTFLEYGLRYFSISFAQEKPFVRLLASELRSILSQDYFQMSLNLDEKEHPIKLLPEEEELLKGFLSQLSQLKLVIVVSLGFRELEEISLNSVTETLQSYDLWIQRLKNGRFDLTNATFLFSRGAYNLKRFMAELKKNEKMKDKKYKIEKGTNNLKELIVQLKKDEETKDRTYKIEALKKRLFSSRTASEDSLLRFVVDSRERWDLLFLLVNHPRGDQPEFYSEILSLVQKRRDEAKAKPKRLLQISAKHKLKGDIILSERGFTIPYRDLKNAETIGPDNRLSNDENAATR